MSVHHNEIRMLCHRIHDTKRLFHQILSDQVWKKKKTVDKLHGIYTIGGASLCRDKLKMCVHIHGTAAIGSFVHHIQ